MEQNGFAKLRMIAAYNQLASHPVGAYTRKSRKRGAPSTSTGMANRPPAFGCVPSPLSRALVKTRYPCRFAKTRYGRVHGPGHRSFRLMHQRRQKW
jgi:hypothetical protein